MIYTVRQVLADFALLYVTNDAKIKLYTTKCLVKKMEIYFDFMFFRRTRKVTGIFGGWPGGECTLL